MSRVKVNFYKLSISEKILKAYNIVDTMEANALFPTPTPAYAEVKKVIEDLEAAYQDALYGGKVRKSVMYVCERNLDNAITGLAGYVQGVSRGDEAIILASGFEARSIGAGIQQVSTPNAPLVKPGRLEGEVAVSWDRVPNARSYSLRISHDNGVTWEDVATYTRSRVVIAGMASGARPWFKVSAFGPLGASNWSEPGTGKVA